MQVAEVQVAALEDLEVPEDSAAAAGVREPRRTQIVGAEQLAPCSI